MCKLCIDIIFPNKSPTMLVFGYEILQCDDVEKLIKKRRGTDATDLPLYHVTIEDTFDTIPQSSVF